jgi:hypothetical protein
MATLRKNNPRPTSRRPRPSRGFTIHFAGSEMIKLEAPDESGERLLAVRNHPGDVTCITLNRRRLRRITDAFRKVSR